MGSLFSPKTTVVQAPQSSQTTYDIPEYLKEFQSSLLDRANVSSLGAYQGYTGDRIAPMSTQETQAGGIISNQIVPQAGALANIGAQQYDTATAQSYMNPYSNTVISVGELTKVTQEIGSLLSLLKRHKQVVLLQVKLFLKQEHSLI